MSYSHTYLDRVKGGGSTHKKWWPVEEVTFLDTDEIMKIGNQLHFRGRLWEFSHEIEPEWTIAADDRRRAEPPAEFDPARYFPNCPIHLHAMLEFMNTVLHIDYLHWNQTGPNNGFYEYRVYQAQNLIGQGGCWGMSLGVSGSLHWPLACSVSNGLLLFTKFPKNDWPEGAPPVRAYLPIEKDKISGPIFDFTRWDPDRFQDFFQRNIPLQLFSNSRFNIRKFLKDFVEYFDGCLFNETACKVVLGYWVEDHNRYFKGGEKNHWRGDEYDLWEAKVLKDFQPFIYDALIAATPENS